MIEMRFKRSSGEIFPCNTRTFYACRVWSEIEPDNKIGFSFLPLTCDAKLAGIVSSRTVDNEKRGQLGRMIDCPDIQAADAYAEALFLAMQLQVRQASYLLSFAQTRAPLTVRIL
jgi:hypothetical protein